MIKTIFKGPNSITSLITSYLISPLRLMMLRHEESKVCQTKNEKTYSII